MKKRDKIMHDKQSAAITLEVMADFLNLEQDIKDAERDYRNGDYKFLDEL